MVSKTNAELLKFGFYLNGTLVRDIIVTGNFFHTIHKVFKGDIAKVGKNDIQIKIISGTGGVLLSDVVLWCKGEAS